MAGAPSRVPKGTSCTLAIPGVWSTVHVRRSLPTTGHAQCATLIAGDVLQLTAATLRFTTYG